MCCVQAPVVEANPLAFIQGLMGPASPIPTPCLVLKGMFDPAECAPCRLPSPLSPRLQGPHARAAVPQISVATMCVHMQAMEAIYSSILQANGKS